MVSTADKSANANLLWEKNIVSATDKLIDADLLWKKNILPWLISKADKLSKQAKLQGVREGGGGYAVQFVNAT